MLSRIARYKRNVMFSLISGSKFQKEKWKSRKRQYQTIGRDFREGRATEHNEKGFSVKVLQNMCENTRMKPLVCVQLCGYDSLFGKW